MTSARQTETRDKGPNFRGARQQEHVWYKASADFTAAQCPLGSGPKVPFASLWVLDSAKHG